MIEWVLDAILTGFAAIVGIFRKRGGKTTDTKETQSSA